MLCFRVADTVSRVDDDDGDDVVLEEEFDSSSSPPTPLDEDTKQNLDQALSDAFLNGDPGSFDKLMDIYSNRNVSLDYRVSKTQGI